MTITCIAQKNVHGLQGNLFFPIKSYLFKNGLLTWKKNTCNPPFSPSYSFIVYFMLYELPNKMFLNFMGKIFFWCKAVWRVEIKKYGELAIVSMNYLVPLCVFL